MKTCAPSTPSIAALALECAAHELAEKDARIADLQSDLGVMRELLSETLAMLHQVTARADRQQVAIVRLHEALRITTGGFSRAA